MLEWTSRRDWDRCLFIEAFTAMLYVRIFLLNSDLQPSLSGDEPTVDLLFKCLPFEGPATAKAIFFELYLRFKSGLNIQLYSASANGNIQSFLMILLTLLFYSSTEQSLAQTEPLKTYCNINNIIGFEILWEIFPKDVKILQFSKTTKYYNTPVNNCGYDSDRKMIQKVPTRSEKGWIQQGRNLPYPNTEQGPRYDQGQDWILKPRYRLCYQVFKNLKMR